MEGITIKEMAEALGLKPNAIQQRLHVAGIEPLTREAIYPPDALERIRDVPGKGRPRKKPDAGQ